MPPTNHSAGGTIRTTKSHPLTGTSRSSASSSSCTSIGSGAMIAMDGSDFGGKETILYTCAHRPVASTKLVRYMLQSGCPFVQMEGTDADVWDELDGRFGGKVNLPGLLVEGCLWIPSVAPNLTELLQEYVIDKMIYSTSSTKTFNAPVAQDIALDVSIPGQANKTALYSTQDALKSTWSTDSRRSNENSTGVPHEILPPCIGHSLDVTSRSQHSSSLSRRQQRLPKNATAAKTSPSGVSASHRFVMLPSGTRMNVADLTRRLAVASQHFPPHQSSRAPSTGTPSPRSVHTFRGTQGLRLWAALFGGQAIDTTDDAIWCAFGQTLVDYGILHNYTPYCVSFKETYLVLQPLKDPYCLNTLVLWSSAGPVLQSHCSRNQSLNVLLRLSRAMDVVCQARTGAVPTTQLTAFLKLEGAVCQLQNVIMPADPTEKVTFALNLHNLIVRHALIMSTGGRGSTSGTDPWPTSLAGLNDLWKKIGYNVGGNFVSVEQLRQCLLGATPVGVDTPRLVADETSGRRERRRLFSRRKYSDVKASTVTSGINIHFDSPVIHTDTRILFAMASGTSSSPRVTTVYPDRWDQGLQCAADSFCRDNILLKNDRMVVLSSLFSWYRHDFGTAPQNIVRSLKKHLAADVKTRIMDMHLAGKLMIKFDDIDAGEWSCCVSKSTKQGCQHNNDQRATKKNVALAPSVAKKMNAIFPESNEIVDIQDNIPSTQAFEIETGCFEPKPTPGLCRIESGESMKFIVQAIGNPQRIFGRQVSTGDHNLKNPPSRKIMESTMLGLDPSTSTASNSITDEMDELGYCQLPQFQAEMSNMTFGSEFDIRINNEHDSRLGNFSGCTPRA